jgi:hypothetical protein
MSSRKNRDYRLSIRKKFSATTVSKLPLNCLPAFAALGSQTIERAEVVRKPKSFAERYAASEKKKGPEVVEAR